MPWFRRNATPTSIGAGSRPSRIGRRARPGRGPGSARTPSHDRRGDGGGHHGLPPRAGHITGQFLFVDGGYTHLDRAASWNTLGDPASAAPEKPGSEIDSSCLGVIQHREQQDVMVPKLHLHIDERSGVPVYRQMMDQIKYYVAGATLRPGDQIPSIRELAAALAVNPTTVVKAYTELEREGVIESATAGGVHCPGRAV